MNSNNLGIVIIFYILWLYRHEGIIIAIAYWQCILEFCFNIFLIIFGFLLHGEHLIVDRLALLIVMGFIYLISPSFYLLADRRFRDVLSQHGVVKALWSLLKQKYDWEENQKIKLARFYIVYKNSKSKGPITKSICLINHKFEIYVYFF